MLSGRIYLSRLYFVLGQLSANTSDPEARYPAQTTKPNAFLSDLKAIQSIRLES